MSIFIFLVFGFIVGSFLNVVIYRLHSEEGGIVSGRSHCRHCSQELQWFENVPLMSFLFLRGKCRHCHEKISWQYPLVEMACASAFVLASLGVGQLEFSNGFLGYSIGALSALVFAAMIVIFVYDLKYMEVPMVVIWFGVGLCSMILCISALFLPGENFYGSQFFLHTLSGVIAFLFFFLLSYVSDETWMGYGDGFIALVIGLFLGPLATFVAIVIAVWVGTFIGLSMVFFGSKGMKSAIPFGPFLVGGMFGAYAVQSFAPQWLSILW